MLNIKKTELPGLLEISPYVFEDFRGFFTETYNKEIYASHGIDVEFVQDDISISTHNVLRGLHGDNETWKLISCLHGKVYFVALNCDEESEHYGKWLSFTLSQYNRKQILIPPKYANGHLVLSDSCIFSYKQSTYYNPAGQFTIKYNDPRFNVFWPVKDPIMSVRDEVGASVYELEKTT